MKLLLHEAPRGIEFQLHEAWPVGCFMKHETALCVVRVAGEEGRDHCGEDERKQVSDAG